MTPTRRPIAPNRAHPLVPTGAAALALAVVLMAALPPARAQVPDPTVPDIYKRSGLISRFVPIEPGLPPDPRRDQWYDTRWGDPPNIRTHPNIYHNGGLYGLRWKAAYTRSYYPSFYGAPGQNTIPPGWTPPHPFLRIGSAWTHPFKPVGMYYDQGSYVPVYDLDPIVPGPGAWPWRFFQKLTAVGG
jgi:hypothetical protein